MIYFDNAATTKYKPESVYEAANFYLREVGVSPGRGSYAIIVNNDTDNFFITVTSIIKLMLPPPAP